MLHRETPSPFSPIGAKGVGEGNNMSTPVCIANAIADALGLERLDLPATPAKLSAHIHGPERERPGRARAAVRPKGERLLTGEGRAVVRAPREQVWRLLLDPATLEAVVPGAHGIEKVSDTLFRAEVTLGVGPVKGRYRAEIELSDLDPPSAATLTGSAEGGIGFGRGSGRITLQDDPSGGTALTYRYEVAIGGKVAAVGGRLLDGAAKVIISQFFATLAAHAGGGRQPTGLVGRLSGLLARLRTLFARRR
jgi:2-furoyl-CoA dehydrogenase large subunit